MSDRIQALAQQLTGKKSIDDCSIDELQHMVQRHPYYAPAQFLLLQKLRQSGTPEQAERQYRKAVLFYHDPLLFEHFISSNAFYVEEIAGVNESEFVQEVETIPFEQKQEMDFAAFKEDIPELQPEIVGDPVEEIAFEKETQAIEESPVQEDALIEADEMIGAHRADQVAVEAEPAPVEVEPEVEPIRIHHEESEPVTVQQGNDTKDIKAEAKPIENVPAANDLTFEPFHTVDYFASQGIKITGEEIPKDKLGKQLKSFTEWLKTMKRLPATQMAEAAESSAEKKVESLASHSVSESNVVTEAMAEVWLKQGNSEKALDIYNKLSLLNPSKKAYFAAKIENLNQS